MKKIFTTFLMVGFVLTAHASFSLTWNYENENEEIIEVAITNDTTIVLSDYEEDFFSGEIVMGVKGWLTIADSSTTVIVHIHRQTTGIKDEFCLGGCVSGNGELNQDISNPLFEQKNLWYTHFYPTEPSVTAIDYTFDDGERTITLTVEYSYEMSNSVENVVAPNKMEGIYNLLGQRMPTDNIHDLPAGIYVVNGKKMIKH